MATAESAVKPMVGGQLQGEEEAAFYTVTEKRGYAFADTAAFQAFAAHCADRWEAGRARRGGSAPDSIGKSPVAAPCLFLYKGGVYDATEFVDAHPGGAQLMVDYHGKDVTTVFHDEYDHHSHTRKALNMLLQYRIGLVERVGSRLKGQYGEFEDYQREELTAYPRMTAKSLIYKDFVIHRDQGLIWQAMFLSLPQYMHLINTPIYTPYCRLFDTAFLEPFSKTKYWVVAVAWLPLSLFWTLRGLLRDNTQLNEAWGSILDPYLYLPNFNWVFQNYPAPVTPAMASYIPPNSSPKEIAALQYRHAVEGSSFNPLLAVSLWLSGIVIWTLVEYFIHRCIFHFERAIPASMFDNPLCKLLHLVLHGIHHIIPMDPDRLVFPPVLFIAASTLIYNAFSYLMTGSTLDLVAGGVVFGYVCYDEIHYYIHHVNPQDFYFKDLKKYHHAHHYVDDTRGFGISNKFWDLVFGTECRKN